MAKKLWGGRFGKKTDPLVEDFTKSINYDYRLAFFDIAGSMTHVEILKESGCITNKEANELHNALVNVFEQIEKGTDEDGNFKYDKNCEDIHTYIQNLVEQELGEKSDLVLKLHTERSRNNQVLFDLKLFCIVKLSTIEKLCSSLIGTLKNEYNRVKGVKIPGYTHLQHAQLIFLSDYLGSYTAMLGRDYKKINSVRKNIKVFLGAGALAGTNIASRHYNKAVKKLLKDKRFKEGMQGFNIRHIGPVSNSLDAVSDRDFVIEILSTLSILGMHLSRLAEDLIIWSTKEFGFVELDDAFATGSSLMPQKKNPDVLELIRGYTGTLYGNLVSVLTMMKGLPLTYNRDMQLDKPPLFSSFEIIEKELKVLPKLIETLTWNKKKIDRTIKNDETLYATDWVYHLVKKKKVPFKKAHDIIGKLVKKFIIKGGIKKVSASEMKKISDKLIKKEILKLMDPEKSVKSRISVDRSRS